MLAPRTRVVYVLPSYDAATGSHFPHLYDLITRAAASLDILVIAERSHGVPAGAPFRFRPQRFAFPPLRFLELILLLLRERLSGARFVYVHYSLFGGAAGWLVMSLTGGLAYYWNCGMPWRYARSWFAERVFRFVLRHTILVTGTAGVAAAYRRQYGLSADRVRILPNGITVERFRARDARTSLRAALDIPADAGVLLFVHHLSRRKGAHHIPEIAASVAGRNSRAMVVVVGAGPEQAGLASSIQYSALRDRVRLLGEVPNERIADYFHAADVFIMPSEEEGFPHVLLEAMAAGLPYVATDVGGVREITPRELLPFVVAPDDIPAFGAAAVRLLGMSPGERAALAGAMRETVRRYDTAAVLPAFLRLFTP